jgi:Tfp pilus assembly protein PilP
LNPFGREKKEVVTTDIATAQQPLSSRTATTVTVSDRPTSTAKESTEPVEEKDEELTPFEQEIKQRHESYQIKIYTYKPYEPPVSRNPFQRMVSSVYIGEGEEGKLAAELSSAEDIRRFVTPELPSGTKFTGLIASGETKLAIIEMEDDTFIAKEGDLIEDKYLVKSIKDDRVIIEINGYEVTQKLGGEEDINE